MCTPLRVGTRAARSLLDRFMAHGAAVSRQGRGATRQNPAGSLAPARRTVRPAKRVEATSGITKRARETFHIGESSALSPSGWTGQDSPYSPMPPGLERGSTRTLERVSSVGGPYPPRDALPLVEHRRTGQHDLGPAVARRRWIRVPARVIARRAAPPAPEQAGPHLLSSLHVNSVTLRTPFPAANRVPFHARRSTRAVVRPYRPCCSAVQAR